MPRPTRATVTMTSGIQFDVVPMFGGWQNGKRRYRLVIESDWGTMKVASIGVDRWPPDVSINLSLPDDWPDEKCVEFGTGIRFYEQGDPHRTAMRLDRGNETR